MNDDLISRSELKNEIERIKRNVEEWVNHTELDTTKALVKISLFEEFIDLIDNAPTINTEDCEGCPYCPNSNSGIPIGVE